MASTSTSKSPLDDLAPLLESLALSSSGPLPQYGPKRVIELEGSPEPAIDSNPYLGHDPDPKQGHRPNLDQGRCARCKSPQAFDRNLREVPCCGANICNPCEDRGLNEKLQNDIWRHHDSHQWVGCLANACQMLSAPQDFDTLGSQLEVPSCLSPQQMLRNAERAREALKSIAPRPSRHEWRLAQRLHKALVEHKLIPDWSKAHFAVQSAPLFPVRSGFLTQLVPIITCMLKTEPKTCASCSTAFRTVDTSNEAAWGYMATTFPGDWTWMVLGRPSAEVLPGCAGKHSLDICPACLPKWMVSGLGFVDGMSGSGNYRFACPMCKLILPPVQVDKIARLIDPSRAPTPAHSLGPPGKPTGLFAGGLGGSGGGEWSSKVAADPEAAARKESLTGAIVAKKPNVRWGDVAGLTSAKHELQRAVIFPARFPNLYDDKRKPPSAILLYGPPGTGKSYLAKAVATEADHTFFSISPGDVVSKWVGESEKLIRELFTLARENKPSLIFIDEIDALCSSREDSSGGNSSSSSGSEHSARMKTELLVQLDGLPNGGGDNGGVVVLAATNLPWALDPAFRRRFAPRVHIPLPDRAARRRLFEVHAGGGRWEGVLAAAGEEVVDRLAEMTEGFSGSDVAQAVGRALAAPLERVQRAEWFRVVERAEDGEGMYTPCAEGEEGAVAMTWEGVPMNRLREPAVTEEDFVSVLRDRKVKASVGAASLFVMRLLRTDKLEVIEYQGQDIPPMHSNTFDVWAAEDPRKLRSDFRMSRWFERGWTLQELIAPGVVHFYDRYWNFIGCREKLLDVIVQVTKISPTYFATGDLSQFSAAQKLSWAARRNTTRPEYIVYCLLELFDINMPLLYGEGERAFQRLQEEILRQSEDDSLFCHDGTEMLAISPLYFLDASKVLKGETWPVHLALLSCGMSESASVLVLREGPPGVFVKQGVPCSPIAQAASDPKLAERFVTNPSTGTWSWKARNHAFAAERMLGGQMQVHFQNQEPIMTPIIRPAISYNRSDRGLAAPQQRERCPESESNSTAEDR
ncbi:hypothetical protein CHGG_09783 [Chaetomium globosum CBS 148.51]|uniref:AAA+ ATPase domain-containing protein n=1 Tax=Chaetomium globosum (strain ATCC 6205 / CBS 148.51 / DSM 1962 / NBRC 6347 / NRRL 1970) TaxID=306901 RepID=Q2GQH1_CHAGB|nr:uncharacterized protein CHGG_09783 [Chaetomium globosum CBS 148.51]EAQ83379.1 hypothetical protein CHGG_09783 [Chaetomium globosum CBS 148.51]